MHRQKRAFRFGVSIAIIMLFIGVGILSIAFVTTWGSNGQTSLDIIPVLTSSHYQVKAVPAVSPKTGLKVSTI